MVPLNYSGSEQKVWGMKKSGCLLLLYAVLFPGTVLSGPIDLGPPKNVDWTPVAKEDRLEVLQFLSLQVKQNYESIDTWSGTYKYQDKLRLSPELISQALERIDDLKLENYDGASALRRLENGVVRFSMDRESDSLNTSLEALDQKVRDLVNDVDIAWPIDLAFQRSVITPEHYLHFEPRERYGRFKSVLGMEPSHGPTAFREAVSETDTRWHGILVDPRKLFGGTRESNSWETLAECADAVSRFPDHEIDGKLMIEVKRGVHESGTCYRVEGTAIVGETTVERIAIYEERVGFNLTSRRDRVPSTGVVEKDVCRDYRSIDGTWVPSLYHTQWMTKDGRSKAFERYLVLEECVLNEKLPLDRFTYAGIGVPDGSRVIDRIEGVGYVYENGELLQPFPFYSGGDATRPAAPQSVRRFGVASRLALTVLCTVALVAVVVLVRRHKKSV